MSTTVQSDQSEGGGFAGGSEPGGPVLKAKTTWISGVEVDDDLIDAAAAQLLAAGGPARLTGTDGFLPRHRNSEFLKFLKQIDREVPKGLQVHLIVDNYATHKHPNVKAWLAKHPRFHLHFTPTSSSWLNMVERWFRDLTDKAIRRGVFHNVPNLIAAIEEYLQAHNDNPKPFVWTATAETILAKVQRGRVTLTQLQNQN